MFLFHIRRAGFVLSLRRIQVAAGIVLSVHLDQDGFFLFIHPFELAILWPGATE